MQLTFQDIYPTPTTWRPIFGSHAPGSVGSDKNLFYRENGTSAKAAPWFGRISTVSLVRRRSRAEPKHFISVVEGHLRAQGARRKKCRRAAIAALAR